MLCWGVYNLLCRGCLVCFGFLNGAGCCHSWRSTPLADRVQFRFRQGLGINNPSWWHARTSQSKRCPCLVHDAHDLQILWTFFFWGTTKLASWDQEKLALLMYRQGLSRFHETGAGFHFPQFRETFCGMPLQKTRSSIVRSWLGLLRTIDARSRRLGPITIWICR